MSMSCPKLVVEIANNHKDIIASKKLRYKVFVEEMGVDINGLTDMLEEDYYDDRCYHLLVKDTKTGEVVASTRILSDTQASQAGSYYSENEFDLTGLLPLPGKVLEIGRTCVHAGYRKGSAISILWSGLSRFMIIHKIDYLIGCASIPMLDGGINANTIIQKLRMSYFTNPDRRVIPRTPLPANMEYGERIVLPPLLKAYLRLGAKVCGELSVDPDFNVADLFILLDMDDLHPRYQSHFLERIESRRTDSELYPLASTSQNSIETAYEGERVGI